MRTMAQTATDHQAREREHAKVLLFPQFHSQILGFDAHNYIDAVEATI